MGITIKEIAKLTGVSRGTVDRALNNRGQVAPDIKAKILKVAKDHGYQKNLIASRLAKKETIKVAVILPDPKQDPFWADHYNGIKNLDKTFEDYGIKIIHYRFDQFSASSYSSTFRQVILDKPNGILVAPLFYKESTQFLSMTLQNKIPVICINSNVGNQSDFAYIGQDSSESGKIAGRLFSMSGLTGKTIAVITLGLSSDNAIHIKNKIEGLTTYNRDNDCNFNIIEWTITDFEDQEKLEESCLNLLETHLDIGGVFFTNSRAYRFIQETSFLQHYDLQPTIIGFDLIEENINLLEENKVQFLLNQSPNLQSYLGLVSFFNHFVHGKDIDNLQYLPIDVVFKENYQRYLESANRMIFRGIH